MQANVIRINESSKQICNFFSIIIFKLDQNTFFYIQYDKTKYHRPYKNGQNLSWLQNNKIYVLPVCGKLLTLQLKQQRFILIEKHIILEDVAPVTFYGVGNSHLQIIKSLYPKLRITARDNIIKVLGDEEEMATFEEQIEKMRCHVIKYNSINDEDILDIVNGKQPKADSVKEVIVYNVSGKPIKCRSKNQQKLVDAFEKHDMLFAIGPAGTGKTYLSIALAVKALKEKMIRKIIQ